METISSNENLQPPQIWLPSRKSGLDFVNSTQRSSLVHLVNRIFDFSMLPILENKQDPKILLSNKSWYTEKSRSRTLKLWENITLDLILSH